MKIELKNIKFAAFASEETNCYNAKIYVDGKPFAEVSNDGRGGCDDVYPLNNVKREDIGKWRERLNEIEAEIKTRPRIESKYFKDGLEQSLEIVCGELLNDYLEEREIKKVLRKVAYIKPDCKRGEYYTLPAKFKPSAAVFAQLRAAPFWKPEFKILNEMPIAEARGYL